jgi:prepilin-type N-terminal cleavage/methylation domain-containing protein
MDMPARTQRSGFTLVELLVVITIILVLAALVVFIIPNVNDNLQATNAAAQLQQWLEVAKQRAARDRSLRGLRLLPGSGTTTQVTDLVYLVQADDYYLGFKQVNDPLAAAANPPVKKTIYSRATLNNVAGAGVVTFDMFDPETGIANPPQAPTPPRTVAKAGQAAALNPVQVGDHIVFDGGGPVYQIAAVTAPAGAITGGTLTLATAFPPTVAAGYTTMEYRIIRQPRPDGDEQLQMPQNVIIDVSGKGTQNGVSFPTLAPYDLTMTATGIDIMFTPDGRVTGTLAGMDKIILWVRDKTVAGDQGDPTLVVVYPRTGLIAAQPVDLSNYNSVTLTNSTPYTFTKTGVRSSE